MTFSLFGLTFGQLLMAAAGVILTVSGQGGQVISLNFWLASFPGGAGPFTVLSLVAPTSGVVSGVVFAVWCYTKKPKLRFMLTKESFALLTAIGFSYALNGMTIVYATPDTPEILQTMLISTGIFWTFLAAGIAELIFRGAAAFKAMDRRAALVPLSFVLCAAGIIAGAGSFKLTSMSSEGQKWTAIFAFSMIPGALFNVLAGEYLNRFSEKPGVAVVSTIASNLSFSANSFSGRAQYRSDPMTVKLSLVVWSAFGQVPFFALMFPLDWTKGYGTASDGADAVHNLQNNYNCIFFGCNSATFWYYVTFTLAYSTSMVGAAILNHYSAPLCSMVTQLSSPMTAVLLLIVPSWNVGGGGASHNLGLTILGLILITAGSVVYVLWSRLMQSEEAERLASGGSNRTGSDPVSEAETMKTTDDSLQGEYKTLLNKV